MSEEKNIDHVPESNNNPEDINENASHEQTIEQSKTQSENMEVHHHPDLHHKRKHFKEYFLEFLMIFLAVTLGFIAENIREHISDRNKEHEFIVSMIADLKKDTSNFSIYESRGVAVIQKIDSLTTLLQSPQKDSVTAKLYYLARTIISKSYPYIVSDQTYSQMKSSGNLSMLHSQFIADSINNYYFDVGLIASQQIFINNFQLEYIKNMYTVFDASIFQEMYSHVTVDTSANARFQYKLKPPTGNPPLIDASEKSVNALIGSVHFLYGRVLNMNDIITNEKIKAIHLMQLLQNEYHLENG